MSAVAAVVLATAFFVGDVADGGVRLRSMHRSRRESATSLVPHPAWNVLGAVGVAGAVWALLGGAAGALVGAVAGVVGAVGLRRLLNSAPADRTDSADLAAAWELMAVCLDSGLPVAASVVAATGRLGGRAGVQLRKTAGLLALGADPAEAWRAAASVTELAVFARAAARSAGTGAALAAVARAEAARARAELADEARARGQRAAVMIAAPLALCHLPAFLALGIAPVVVGLAGEALARWT